jgi:hypothetical protein
MVTAKREENILLALEAKKIEWVLVVAEKID